MKVLFVGLMICLHMRLVLSASKKVLIALLDGCRTDALKMASTPNIDGMIAEGRFFENIKSVYPTETDPGIASVLTGVCPIKHGIRFPISNRINRNVNISDEYPPFFRRVKEVNENIKTYSLSSLISVRRNILKYKDADLIFSNKEEGVAMQVLSLLSSIPSKENSIIFYTYDGVDYSGHHETEFHPEASGYLQAIEKYDFLFGKILSQVRKRVKKIEEEWLIVLFTDHGGVLTSHGGQSRNEVDIWMAVSTFYNNKSPPPQETVEQKRDNNGKFMTMELPEIINEYDDFSIIVIPRIVFKYLSIPILDDWDWDDPLETLCRDFMFYWMDMNIFRRRVFFIVIPNILLGSFVLGFVYFKRIKRIEKRS